MFIFKMNKEILPSMLDRNRGQIVAISSLISLIGTHSASAYTASKWGVTGKFLLCVLWQ